VLIDNVYESKAIEVNEEIAEKWAVNVVRKKIGEDIEKRSIDPNCRLSFIENEAFEKTLMKRTMTVSACWVAGFAVCFFSTVFFYRLVKED
jgi:hypothetical protein